MHLVNIFIMAWYCASAIYAVRLSFRLSYASIVPEWLNVGSQKQHRWTLVLCCQRSRRNFNDGAK